jgi:diguanylate cyclase (GGDEF)-like protein
LHFLACIFQHLPGIAGSLAVFVSLSALTWAGGLFMWASVPYRKEHSSPLLPVALQISNTVYIGVAVFAPPNSWTHAPAAALIAVIPLALTVLALRAFWHPLRCIMALLYGSLSVFILLVQYRVGNGIDLALNAILFSAFFACCVHFWFMYRRATAGAFITVAGFFFWSSVFVMAPLMNSYWAQIHIEDEVWNLPKYLVAVGMILLLLENEIEHNKYLALHDELTGLPNRRLFHDRLASAIERARRTGGQTALLLVDLDHFKEVNDTLGHHVGDLLLQHVSAVFAGRVRRSDTVARTGGDEFSLILEAPTSRDDANRVRESLMSLLNVPIELRNHPVHVGASVGVAVFPDDAANLENLCIAADLRMYANKHGDPEKIDLSPSNRESVSHANNEMSAMN